MKNEIQQMLEQLAYKRTNAFCYSCYIKAPTGVCPQCHSDDLMRELEGVGVEWGVDWVINHMLEEELVPCDLEIAFEESVRQCFSETTLVGWMTFDTVDLMKSQDPVSWQYALSEYEGQEESGGNIISFDGGATYFWVNDLQALLEQKYP